MINYLRNIFPFKKLSPKLLMTIATSTIKRKLKPRVPLFEQHDHVKHLWIVIKGSLILSKTTKESGIKEGRQQKKTDVVKSQPQRHELEICSILTIIGSQEVFQSHGIPVFDYDGISGSEGCTCLGIALTTMREIYNKTGQSKNWKIEKSPALQESLEWLQKYGERRNTWHSIRNGFCKTYSNISLALTRKLQTLHYGQCGRCGRLGHDALDSFVCPLNGFESLPPLNEDEDRKRMEERKDMAKKKLASRFASPKSSKNFHLLSLELTKSPKRIFSLNAGDDNSKVNAMLTTYQRKKMVNLALERKKSKEERKPNMTHELEKIGASLHSITNAIGQGIIPMKPSGKDGEGVYSRGSRAGKRYSRRNVVFTPIIPFQQTPEVREQDQHAAQKMSRHEQAITLVKQEKKYGRRCRSMLRDTYPNLNLSENAKFTKKSPHCALCRNVGHTTYNCHLVPITELEQRKILNDILQEREMNLLKSNNI